MMRTVQTAAAVLLALCVTIGLFFLMQLLISADDTPPSQGERRFIGDISIPEIELEPRREQPKPLQPVEPEPAPELPPIETEGIAAGEPGFRIPAPVTPTQGFDGGAGITVSDADYLPIVTFEPQYPTRALNRGIEGWCHVRFTVDENGAVIDPVVLDAEPAGMFDSAALRAISRFKFNPRVENGKAVQVSGVEYVFTFRLEGEAG